MKGPSEKIHTREAGDPSETERSQNGDTPKKMSSIGGVWILTGMALCESHVVMGCIVDHIVPLHQVKKNRFHIVSFGDIIDVCIYVKFSDSEVGYAAYFPNHFEKD